MEGFGPPIFDAKNMANNKFSLFGFTIGRNSVEAANASQQSFTPPQNDDGALTIQSAAYYGTYVDLEIGRAHV